jgi:hypothetical protein
MPALREIFAEYDIRFDPRRQLTRGNQSVNQVRDRLRALTPVVQAASSAFGRLAVAVGGAAMVRSMGRFIGGIIRAGDDLDKTSQQLGLTVRQLQVFRHAAQLGGVDAAAFSQSMRQMQQNAEAASRGGGEAADYFRRLGVDVRHANGELLTGRELLIAVGRGLQGVTNSTERTAIAQRILGESGSRLMPMLASIANGTEDLERELDTLGGGLSELAVRRSVELTDSLARLRVSFDSFRSAIAVRVIPAINWITRTFTRLIVGVGDIVEHSHIMEVGLVGLVAAITLTTTALLAMSPTALVIAAIAVAVAALVLVIDDLWVGMNGGKSVIRDLIDAGGELVGVTNAGTRALNAMADALKAIQQRASQTYNFVAGLLNLPAFTDSSQDGGFGELGLQQGQNIQRGFSGAVSDFYSSIPVVGPAMARAALGSSATDAQSTALQRRRIGGEAPRAHLLTVRPDVAPPPTAADRFRAGGLSPRADLLMTPRNQPVNQTVTAPMTVNVVANEATDAQEVGRIVETKVRAAQERQNRELQAALLPAGAAAQGGTS